MDELRPWLIVALVVGSATLTAVHYSLREYSRVRLEARLGRRAGRRLDLLEEQMQDFLLATAGLRQVVNLLLVLMLAEETPILLPEAGHGLQFLITAVSAAVLLTVFSVAVPLAWAGNSGNAILAWSLPVLSAVRVLSLPMLWIMRPAEALFKRVGNREKETPESIEGEILQKLSEGEKEGVLAGDETLLFRGVIEFGDTRVGQIMTPRPDLAALPVELAPADAARLMAESGHTRLPVFRETLDNIVGVVYAADLLRMMADPAAGKTDLKAIARPPVMVPDGRTAGDLLRLFRRKGTTLAVVMDEYGGTAGLVSEDDLLRIIVGDLPGEGDRLGAEPALRRISRTTVEVDGRTRVTDINGELAVPLPESDQYDTVAGFVAGRMGRIPKAGEALRYRGLRITVTKADERRIARVRIEELPDDGTAPVSNTDTLTPEGVAAENVAADNAADGEGAPGNRADARSMRE